MQAGKWETILFNMTQVVVIARLLLSLAAAFGINFIAFFHLSVTLWTVLLGIWAWRFFPVLFFKKML
jgi:hypothetical protein